MITTRSRGFPLHDYPGDFWRYEPDDMRARSADCDLVRMERDEADPGIFVVVRTPEDPAWGTLSIKPVALWSVHSDTRSLETLRTNHRRHWPPLTTLTACSRLCTPFSKTWQRCERTWTASRQGLKH